MNKQQAYTETELLASVLSANLAILMLVYVQFYGEYIINNMDIQTVQHIPDYMDLGIIMRQEML